MGSDFDFDSVRRALVSAMEKKGIAPTTLSQRVGKSKSLVKNIIDDGNDIKLSTLTRLANELDIDVCDLLPGRRRGWPNEATLRLAFDVLLESVGVDPREGARAHKLAVQFPDALEAATVLLSQTREAVESIPVEAIHAGDIAER